MAGDSLNINKKRTILAVKSKLEDRPFLLIFNHLNTTINFHHVP